jgi:hypothetical protein
MRDSSVAAAAAATAADMAVASVTWDDALLIWLMSVAPECCWLNCLAGDPPQLLLAPAEGDAAAAGDDGVAAAAAASAVAAGVSLEAASGKVAGSMPAADICRDAAADPQ